MPVWFSCLWRFKKWLFYKMWKFLLFLEVQKCHRRFFFFPFIMMSISEFLVSTVAFFSSLDIHFPPRSLFFSETPSSKIVRLLDVLYLNLLKPLLHGEAFSRFHCYKFIPFCIFPFQSSQGRDHSKFLFFIFLQRSCIALMIISLLSICWKHFPCDQSLTLLFQCHNPQRTTLMPVTWSTPWPPSSELLYFLTIIFPSYLSYWCTPSSCTNKLYWE